MYVPKSNLFAKFSVTLDLKISPQVQINRIASSQQVLSNKVVQNTRVSIKIIKLERGSTNDSGNNE